MNDAHDFGDFADYDIVTPDEDLPNNLFVFPITQAVIFPNMMVPLSVPPGELLEAVERAQAHNDFMGFLFNPNPDDVIPRKGRKLARVGTVGKILRLQRNSEGGFTMLVQSLKRLRVTKFLRSEKLIAQVEYLSSHDDGSEETQALWRNIQRTLAELIEINPQIPKELLSSILSIDTPGKLADMVTAHFPLSLPEKQRLLEMLDVRERLEAIFTHLLREMDLIRLGNRIQDQIREKIEESQKEFFLREQLKAIRRELGEERDEKGLSVQEYEEKIAVSGMSDEAEKVAREELRRLMMLPPEAAEYNIIRTYLDWLVDLPWGTMSPDNLDLRNAERLLDKNHSGLVDVKERIIEFLAVKYLNPEQRGRIICFVGPPGVGKTSLGRSITKAIDREFFRFSLGGMRDEAEIKGHRRTYIGAMPGKIIQGLKRVGTRNPVFVLDEIDKLGSDWRGDPSSAMLEVLDPEQNHNFLDHYLDVPFDLSQVMFIATANNISTIPRPLLDRMEVIEISGYIEDEKLQIAQRHLIPKQRREHGLSTAQIKLTPAAVRRIVHSYTREAGVRDLERQIARVCRKVAARIAKEESEAIKVQVANLEDFLGPPRFIDEVISRGQAPGIAAGLAWTPVGGDVLFVETTRMPGRGRLKITGKLGDVMSESVQIAFSFVQAHMRQLRIDPELFKDTDFHVHFPAGAVPKDGPSAGITIVTSILSLIRGEPIRSRLAMTGEITLVGNVLPVGGIKEKVVAARRAGAREVVMPERNRGDLLEIPEHIKSVLEFHFVSTYKDVDRVIFGSTRSKKSKRPTSKAGEKKPAKKKSSTRSPARK